MDAIYFGDETMFAGLFGTPTRNRGADSDSAPSSQHAAEQKARGEAWMLYFDAIAGAGDGAHAAVGAQGGRSGVSAEWIRWSCAFLQVFNEAAFGGLVDQAFEKLKEDDAVSWALFRRIVDEVRDALPSLIQGMRGEAASLSSIEMKDLQRMAERLMDPKTALDIVSFTHLFKFIAARLIVASVLCGAVPPFQGLAADRLAVVTAQVQDIMRDQTLCFAPKKFEVLPEAAAILDQIQLVLVAHPEVRMRVEAHADSAGKPNTEALDLLSERRARACVEYLIQRGIGARRLAAKGWGARHPLTKGSDSKRVEFHPF